MQWRIQDFPEEGTPTLKEAIIWPFCPKNCMKLKEFGPPGGGGRVPGAPPLDPPMPCKGPTRKAVAKPDYFASFLPKNRIKMKEIGPRRGRP